MCWKKSIGGNALSGQNLTRYRVLVQRIKLGCLCRAQYVVTRINTNQLESSLPNSRRPSALASFGMNHLGWVNRLGED